MRNRNCQGYGAAILLWSLFASATWAQEARGTRHQRLVIQGGILVDGLGNPARGPVDIVVEGGRITAIVPVDEISLSSPGFRRPEGDRVIEAAGNYVVPGLIEMHGHIPEGRVVPAGEWGRSYAYKLWLAHGVTTVRDLGSSAGLDVLVEDARRSAANEIAAPRIVPYAGWPGQGRPGESLETDAVKAKVQRLHAEGAKGIKVFGPTYTDVLNALTEEARKLGMGVAIHVAIGEADAAVSARAGVTSIEHWYGIPDAAIPGVQTLPSEYNFLDELARFRYAGKLWKDAEPELLERVMQTFLDNGTTLDPTFVAYEPNRDLTRAQNLPWYDKYALPVMLEYWQPNPSHHGSYHYEWTTDDEVSWRQNFRLWMDFVHEFWRRGGSLTVASDPGGSFGLFGFTYIREMELYREMGLDPINIIEAASTTGARVLGIEGLAKGVRLGAIADLVVVNGNPLKDLKVFYGTGVIRLGPGGKVERSGGVRYTIKEGIVYEARALLADVEAMVRKVKEGGTPTSH
jgi:imidazolonepropionase-like amidohydrolase